MVVFTYNVKKIKGAAHKNGEVDGMCKRAFNVCVKFYIVPIVTQTQGIGWRLCYHIHNV